MEGGHLEVVIAAMGWGGCVRGWPSRLFKGKSRLLQRRGQRGGEGGIRSLPWLESTPATSVTTRGYDGSRSRLRLTRPKRTWSILPNTESSSVILACRETVFMYGIPGRLWVKAAPGSEGKRAALAAPGGVRHVTPYTVTRGTWSSVPTLIRVTTPRCICSFLKLYRVAKAAISNFWP